MVIIGTQSPPPTLYISNLNLQFQFQYQSQSQSQSQTQICNPILCLKSTRVSKRGVAAIRSSGDQKERVFLDENGVVDDMDGYLNHLSLEYDTVWDTKPAWCQPWTIVLTGASVVGASWVALESPVITTMASLLIGAWWYIFLYSYPKSYADMIAERRKKVTSGVEDTFGMGKMQ